MNILNYYFSYNSLPTNIPATAHPSLGSSSWDLPLRGEPWGEAGGLECKEDAMDIVSSVCFLLLTSSDKLNDFCGEPVPMKTMGSVTAYYSSFELLISV